MFTNKSSDKRKELMNKISAKNALQRENELVQDVINDFAKRQMERKLFESSWRLNMNFVMGNQYCTIGADNEIIDYDRRYYWQEREVYNHIASIIDVRLSKLNNVRPSMSVIPASSEVRDIASAKMSKSILDSITHKIDLDTIICDATSWCEVCGTVFTRSYGMVSQGTA